MLSLPSDQGTPNLPWFARILSQRTTEPWIYYTWTVSARTNRGTRKLGSGRTTKSRTSRTLARPNKGIPNPPAWTNSLRVDTRTQHFHARPDGQGNPEFGVRGDPRTSHTCTLALRLAGSRNPESPTLARIPSRQTGGPKISHTRTTTPARMGVETPGLASGRRRIPEFRTPGHSRSVLLGHRTPRISHACTNSIPTDRGAPNFMDLDDARPGERGEPLV